LGLIAVIAALGFLRLRSKYTHREIEDIVIYDRDQKQTLDYDSPAILEVYFKELRMYEDMPYYYRKSVPDRNKTINNTVENVALNNRRPYSNPLQNARVVIGRLM
jgi:hypothetical protein